MATGQILNLVDVATRLSPDGAPRAIAEMLSQHNPLFKDMVWQEAAEMGRHVFAWRTSMPAGQTRMYNTGTNNMKSTTAEGTVSMCMLDGFSQIDEALLNHSGKPEHVRWTEQVGFIEGLGQTMTQLLLYGNAATNPTQINGMSTFYNTLSTSSAANAVNVLNGGGSGSSNSSIWMMGHGNDKVYGVYPRDTPVGITSRDYGATLLAYDAAGNPFPAMTTYYSSAFGIVPQDWRYAVRIANLDTTAAGLAGTNAPDLFALVRKALLLPPSMTRETSGVVGTDAPDDETPVYRPVLYSNRTIRYYADIQAIRNRNVLLSDKDYAGNPITTFNGIPWEVCDRLVNTEATVS